MIPVKKVISDLVGAGLNYSRIAEYIGVHRSNISRWARGVNDIKYSDYARLIDVWQMYCGAHVKGETLNDRNK